MDRETINYACRALFFLSDKFEEEIAHMLGYNGIQLVIAAIQFLGLACYPAVLLLFNISAASDEAANMLIARGGNTLRVLGNLLAEDMDTMIKIGVLGLMGNLVAGTHAQREAVLATGLLPTFVSLLGNEDERVRHYASTIIRNLAEYGTLNHSQQIVQAGLLRKVIPLLLSSAEELQSTALCLLQRILDGTEESREKTQFWVEALDMGCFLQTLPYDNNLSSSVRNSLPTHATG